MRRSLASAGFACLLGCAEWRLPPTFPRDAAGGPLVHEQALLGLSDSGAAVAELIDADGEEPSLSLRIFDARAPAARNELVAPPQLARAAAQEIRAQGRARIAVLQTAAGRLWPQAMDRARALGFAEPSPQPIGRPVAVAGVQGLGAIPLTLRLHEAGPGALILALADLGGGESADEVELLRATISGERIAPQLFIQGAVVWLLSGSFLPSEPLHRAVGLRHASLRRGEAMLHDAHGLADHAAGDLDAARREFDRAIAADPQFVEALYNAAAAAAAAHREEEAVALLRRAARVDPARVQVLGRGDEDLKLLRKRAEVRALLGLQRPPREDVPPPP